MSGLGIIAAAAAVAVVFAVATVVLQVWRHPMAHVARKERRSLARQGFKKSALDTSVGKITFWEGGSGPVLVFLHGAGDQAGTWSQVLPQLSSGRHVLLIDQAGHGDSEPREGRLSLGMELASVESVLDARAPNERVVLVGNSMGAWVAMLYAYRHPERASLVVAVNGGAISGIRSDVSLMPVSREEARNVLRLTRGAAGQRVPRFVLDDLIREARRGPIGRLSQDAENMPQYVLDDRLKDFKVPVEIVWGEEDGLLGLDYAKRLVEALHGARLHLLPNCAHIPQRQCPAGFAAKVSGLLNEHFHAAAASAH